MIKTNDVVTLHYTVSSADGTELDSSREGEPLLVLLGTRFLIQGLEEAIVGRKQGDSFIVTIEPDKAYGERHEALIQTVPVNMFEGIDVEPGMSFRATTDEGEQSVIVIDVDDEQVVVDGNHPLSGMSLTFNVDIIDVRPPTADELTHGHAHGAGGCQH